MSEHFGTYDLFKEYLKHTALASAIFILLVLVTLGLNWVAHLLESLQIQFLIIQIVEIVILVLGGLVLLGVMVYATVVMGLALYDNFRRITSPEFADERPEEQVEDEEENPE